MKKYLLLLLLPLLFIHFTKPSRSKPRTGKDYALLFAVEDYTDERLGKLQYPISNAENIKNELRGIYNFDCKLVKNPTTAEIFSELEAFAQKFASDVEAQEGQFFIFFSGHGDRDKSGNGYFLTRNTDSKDLASTAFSYALGREIINKNPCKHILVAIDACKSGTFAASERNGVLGRGNELSAIAKLIIETQRRKTRLFFSSGSKGANTPDNSQFVKQFTAALVTHGNTGKGRNDHILTMGEVNASIEIASPVPTFGKFGDNEEGSNFCFITPEGEEYIKKPENNVSIADVDDDVASDASFVRVYNGSFKMGDEKGSDSQKPPHNVQLKNFFISPFEVTFEAYDAYCEANKDKGISKPKDGGFGRGKRPVINVSWLDAVKYCNWLSEKEGYPMAYRINEKSGDLIPNSKGYRLPTEAEWEYAATFNDKNTRFTYSGSENADIVAVTNENSRLKTAVVGSKNPNSLGLYDMSGNVAEWTDDCWEKNYNNAKSDGAACKSGDCDARVVRGGSFLLVNRFATNYARIKKGLSSRSNECGFRVIRSQ